MSSNGNDKEKRITKTEDNIIHVDFGAAKKVHQPQKKESNLQTANPSNLKKYEIFKTFLNYGTTMISLRTNVEGVVLPKEIWTAMTVNLNFDYRYNLSDFVIDTNKVSATLSFSGKNHWCCIPWEAVYMIQNREEHLMEIFLDGKDDHDS